MNHQKYLEANSKIKEVLKWQSLKEIYGLIKSKELLMSLDLEITSLTMNRLLSLDQLVPANFLRQSYHILQSQIMTFPRSSLTLKNLIVVVNQLHHTAFQFYKEKNSQLRKQLLINFTIQIQN